MAQLLSRTSTTSRSAFITAKPALLTSSCQYAPLARQQCRPLHSSQQLAVPSSIDNAISPPPTLTNSMPANAINPPHTIRPPPLHLPTRQPDQSSVKYYISLGKSYLTFYKTSIASVYANHQTCQLLKARLASTPPAPTPPLDPPPYDPFVREKKELSRAEFQLLVRHKADMKRVPAFAVVFAVFGEWTPLIVPWITKVVPGPCRLPGQVKKEVEGLEARRGVKGMFGLESAEAVKDVDVRDLGRKELLDLSRTFGLHARFWDRVGLDGVWPPSSMLRRSVRRNLKYLAADDELLARGDAEVEELLEEELKIACTQRGMLVTGQTKEELIGRLQAWMGHGNEEKVEKS